ncbi:MAG: isocitrate lyase/PEP mutase family protein [Chloroflexota bacterium]
MEQRKRFRELLGGPNPVVGPGVYDCLSAKLVEQAGFPVAMVTGAGLIASLKGVPDVGLATMTEVLEQTRNIVRSVKIPVMADCDTGYGNPINVIRTVQEFEAAGVAGLFIEDQVAPKKCGHFEGKRLVSRTEMLRKIQAALEARTDPEMVIMARTDAIAVYGVEEALARARAYAEAGVDMLFVEAPRSREQLAHIARELRPLGLPLMANMVEGGKTPVFDVGELAEMGFKYITFSGSLQRTALKAMQGLLEVMKETGSVKSYYPGRMLSQDERSELLGLPKFYELERRLLAE